MIYSRGSPQGLSSASVMIKKRNKRCHFELSWEFESFREIIYHEKDSGSFTSLD